MQIISEVSGFLETYTLQEGVTNMVSVISRSLIITSGCFAATCWHLSEVYVPGLAPWGLGFISHM